MDTSNIIQGNRKRLWLPVRVIKADKTIDMKGASILDVWSMTIAKGRTLKIINCAPYGNILINVKGKLMNDGSIRIIRLGESNE